jgi:hypothetical protein
VISLLLRSVVSARVLYDDNPTVDLTDFQRALRGNQSREAASKEETVVIATAKLYK